MKKLVIGLVAGFAILVLASACSKPARDRREVGREFEDFRLALPDARPGQRSARYRCTD